MLWKVMEMSSNSNDYLRALLEKMEDTAEFSELTLTDVNERGNLGNTPLHVAAVWGDVRAIECLLDHGADVNAVGEFGETPLHVAVQIKHSEEIAAQIIKLLLAHGASTSVKNDLGKTPIDFVREVKSPLLRLFPNE
jgi:ankyrin repeat protein